MFTKYLIKIMNGKQVSHKRPTSTCGIVATTPARVVLWPPLLTSKPGGQDSSPGRTSTHGLKIIEEEGLPLH